jgi:hypothetical protein
MRHVTVGSIAILVLGIGCSAPIAMAPRAALSAPKHTVDSNVSIGDVTVAVVGNPVLHVKDYWITTQTSDSMTPSSGFIFKGGPNMMQIMDGQKLNVIGENKQSGRNYKVLQVPSSSMSLLVDSETGSLSSKVINKFDNTFGSPTVMIWNFKSSPENIKFVSSSIESVASSYTYINYEFIYSGKSGNTISFLYREYTAQDLAKPAFSQTVTYEITDKIIQFKNIKLEILKIGSSTITAKVLSL